MELADKLSILADAAKYDASCSSSGTVKRNSRAGGGIGSTTGNGICHSYTPDGRCVSLLKILLTNFCIYDCLYCINRASSGVQRARFSVEEVVRLTLDFYRRNYIEGLFLSSGIIRNPDYTMEQIVEVARKLREEHAFRGYIHLKTIPSASPELLEKAGRYADRVSVNIELPTQADLSKLAPEKDAAVIEEGMGVLRERIKEAKEEKTVRAKKSPVFAPAGQTTQMIVGATPTADREILQQASSLYTRHRLRRVYYSAFSPIPDSSNHLPLIAPPLVRENRLYQADWLMRFYGFRADELTTDEQPNLDASVDPKTAWALRHREVFPVDVNRAPRELLLRVPGLGVRNVVRILQIRRWRRLRLADLTKLHVPVKRALPFIQTVDHTPHLLKLDGDRAVGLLRKEKQLDLFPAAGAEAKREISVVTGEL